MELRFCMLLLVLLGALLPLCSAAANDIVLKNGKIYTVKPNTNWDTTTAQAIVFDKTTGTISYVGDNAGAAQYETDAAQVVDLGGKAVFPGFFDTHLHPLEARATINACELYQGTTTIEEFQDVWNTCKNNIPEGTDWVLGSGHDILDVLRDLNKNMDPLAIIDAAIPDKPAIMLEYQSHSAWVNSKALEVMGWTDSSPDPPGGVLHKVNGKLTGIIFENAGNMCFHKAAGKVPMSLVKVGLKDGIQELTKKGITAIIDGRTYWDRDNNLEAWKELESANELNIRVALNLWVHPEKDDTEQIAKLKTMFSVGPQTDLVRVTQVKVYSDGVIDQGTAALLNPYSQAVFSPDIITTSTGNEVCGNSQDDDSDSLTDCHDPDCATSSSCGLNYFDEARLTKYVKELECDPGFDFHVHVIGDRAAHEALNAFAAGQSTNGDCRERRHLLTHVWMMDSTDIPRVASLGVTADLQLDKIGEKAEYQAAYSGLLGSRSTLMFPSKEIYDAGGRVTLSSDWDVAPDPNPWIFIERAVREQKMPSLKTAIEAKTYVAAVATSIENATGSLEVGKQADIVVLDKDPMSQTGSALAGILPVLVLLDGQQILRDEAQFSVDVNKAASSISSSSRTKWGSWVSVVSIVLLFDVFMALWRG